MANTTENIQKIKDLAYLYDIILNHLQLLSNYTNSKEQCYVNKQLITDLNKAHEQTRGKARVILSEDLSKLSPNLLYRLMAKDLNSTSIQFINITTDLTQEMVDLLVEEESDVDSKQINELIEKISDFNKIAQKQFKPLKEKLLKIA